MSKKVRILYTIPNFKTAGSQYVVRSLLKGMDKSDFEVYIGVEKFPETIPPLVSKEHQISFSRTGHLWKDAVSFSRVLKKNKIDLVHSWDYKSEFVESIGCKLAFVRYLYTKKNDAWSKRWFLKSFLATHIAYDNPDMKRRFFSHGLLRNKITFIPHGVDTTLFKPSDEKKSHSKVFNICTIGNIGANKNQLFLIEVLQTLPEHVHLIIYGKAHALYLEQLKNEIKKKALESRVHIHGFVSNTVLPNILQKQDLFVLASKREGLPVSVLEALACGVPVLCSDSGGGSRYIFGNLADEHIFEVNNQQEFIALLKPFLENSSYYSKKRLQAIDLAKQFDVQKEVSSYSNLYKSLA